MNWNHKDHSDYTSHFLFLIYCKLQHSSNFLRFFQALNTFPVFQSARSMNHSMVIALCRILSQLVVENSNGNWKLFVKLILSAAVVTVDDDALIKYPSMLDIGDTDNSWFSTYLKERSVQWFIRESYSKFGHIKPGIAQGRINGPILSVILTTRLQYHLFLPFNTF